MPSFYQIAKRTALKLIPKSILLQLEPSLRRLVALPYYGNQHLCNICNARLKRFVQLDRGDALCPVCGSLPRQRRLWLLLQEEYPLQGNILHFSPAKPIASRLKQNKHIHYITTDYEGEFKADQAYDITNIPIPDQQLDWIICYHVLEHIPDDQKAMSELFRILKPNGRIFIQTPFKEGAIYENPAIQTAQERLEHFGQEDHVRIYSVNGLKNRLQSVGFKLLTRSFKEQDAQAQRLGLKAGEVILIAQRKTE